MNYLQKKINLCMYVLSANRVYSVQNFHPGDCKMADLSFLIIYSNDFKSVLFRGPI